MQPSVCSGCYKEVRMMKKILALLLTLFAVCLPAVSVSAADEPPRLVDAADLLSDEEEAELSDLLDEISLRQKLDVVVVTNQSLGGRTVMEYSDDLFDEKGYGFGEGRDGILLLVSMETRDWHISTRGYAITAFTDAGLTYLSEQFLGDLKDGYYASAFTTFARQCDDFITQAKTGEPYDVDHLPEPPFPFFFILVLSLLVGFVIALIATGIMRSQLKSVRCRDTVEDYTKKDSLKLTKENDLFLYSKVDRRKKQEESSSSSNKSGGSTTHKSSSGATHGGIGGKF